MRKQIVAELKPPIIDRDAVIFGKLIAIAHVVPINIDVHMIFL